MSAAERWPRDERRQDAGEFLARASAKVAAMTFDELDELRRASDGLPPTALLGRSLDATVEAVMQSPVTKEFIRTHALHIDGSAGAARITTPLDVLGERNLLACVMALSPEGEGIMDLPDRGYAIMAMLLAVPMLWRHEMRELALESPLPDHVISRELLPFPYVWWSWEWGAKQPDSDITYDGMLLAYQPDGLGVVQVGASGDDSQPAGHPMHMLAQSTVIPFGARWPDDVPEDARPAVEQILQMLAFLASPYIPKDQRRMDRKLRLSLRRAGATVRETETAVTFIDLRTAQATHRSLPTGEGQKLTKRVPVRAHTKAHWYPSQQAHKVIYIPAHFRGPEDGPYSRNPYQVMR